jgi:hypothetical protein
VRRYIRSTYDRDILSPANDRLEEVMGLIYTDLFNPLLADEALQAFRRLLNLFTRRLAATTNGIEPTNKRLVYRIIANYLANGVKPEDLTIITFNQDIQVEKMLHLMASVRRWAPLADKIFAFPALYGLPPQRSRQVTIPSGPSPDIFDHGGDADNCIRLMKLHGSLNWYSSHSSQEPSREAMFRPTRVIHITRRRNIDPGMALQSTQRQLYTLPVIVPPVTHKSAVLHSNMIDLWSYAEKRLRDAEKIVIFGYSCPALDVESSNQLRRSQIQRRDDPVVSVLDPSAAVAQRYITLLGARRLHYYASGHDFLDDPARV